MPVLSPPPSEALLAFAQRQISQAQLYQGPERRLESRRLVAQPALVYPADENLSPTGLSCSMVICDIASRGLGLLCEERVDWLFVLIRIPFRDDEPVRGAKFLGRRPAGPFHSMGCEILTASNVAAPLSPRV